MTLVVDASVAIKFLVQEADTDIARQLLIVPDPLIAPDWLLIEAAHTFWRKVKRSELLAVHAQRHLEDLPEFFQKLVPSADLIEGALALALRLRHSVYDCLYAHLAIREKLVLVTADEGLASALRRNGYGDYVRLLSD